MATRYPGTQFIVKDNSQTTAIVPVSNTNASTPTYMSCFRSVKGPENIITTKGNIFYDKYGTQDYIKFEKYGQPLFQASMNINNGASIIGKRAVLDDATLANATLAVTLTKTKNSEGDIKYSISPVVFSIDNSDVINTIDTTTMVETKEIIDLYKKYIIESIENKSSDDIEFLKKVGIKLPTPITKSIKDANSEVVGVSSLSRYAPFNTISSNFSIEDIKSKRFQELSTDIYFMMEYVEGGETKYKYEKLDGKYINSTDNKELTNIEFLTGIGNDNTLSKNVKEIYICFDIERDNVTNKTTKDAEGLTKNADDVVTEVTAEGNYPKALLYISDDSDKNSKCIITKEMIRNALSRLSEQYNLIANLSNCTEEEIEQRDDVGLINGDLYTFNPDYNKQNCPNPSIEEAVSNNHAIKIVEYTIDESSTYIFPIFTIFDNGRGESIKNISLSFDANSSKTLKKAVYKLSVHNYKTNTLLESFAFTINPYEINPSTGYSFDIESAVNYVSNQIEVKTYYDSYDALNKTLQELLNTNSETVVSDHDILFGHLLTGNYPAYNSISLNQLLKRKTNLYDYSNLNVFGNNNVTVNISYNSENTTNKKYTGKVKYYFYDYNRTLNNLSERLEYGTDGYCIERKLTKIKYDGIESEIDLYTLDKDADFDIIKITGNEAGKSFENPDLPPIYSNNFISTTRTVTTVNIMKYDKFSKKWEYITHEEEKPDGSKENVKDITRVNLNCSKLINNIDELNYIRTYDGDIRYIGTDDTKDEVITIYIPYTEEFLYQEQYRRFFGAEFDRNICNLDIYFPNAIFDANYSNIVKLAIQRLVAYRGDLMCYMDMGINGVNSYEDCLDLIPTEDEGKDLVENNNVDYPKYYVRDMHIAVTCLYYSIRNPYSNKIITVSATYGLSNLYINHFTTNPSAVFAGISNGVTIDGIIEGTVNYIPKIYPTSNLTSLTNIGNVYPSDDSAITNEKQLMCDLRVNYGCYYDSRFSIETEYTMHPVESEFSYWNNVVLVCLMMQAIRKACPAARYQFVTKEDLEKYQAAVSNAMVPWRNKFASLNFRYYQDENALQNKIFYAAIEVSFKPFAQAEIFTLTALNYSTMNANITNI